MNEESSHASHLSLDLDQLDNNELSVCFISVSKFNKHLLQINMCCLLCSGKLKGKEIISEDRK